MKDYRHIPYPRGHNWEGLTPKQVNDAYDKMKGGNMETPNFRKTKIGTKEAKRLKPATVKILGTTLETVGEKGGQKVVCMVKHPDSDDPIKISSVKFEKKGKLENSGLWYNLDDDKNIRKGSSIAVLLAYLGCADIDALEGRDIATLEDDSGYLTFKAY